jgi:2-oxoglutarate ferredoxin oxidoreductase subunit alpha
MRAGPGLGNIWPAQGDYFQATKGGGHGDYRLIVLAPSSVQESYDLTRRAFELADRYRIPAMVLSDGMLGQMMEGLQIPEDEKIPVLIEKPWALTGAVGRKPNVARSLFMGRDDVEKNNLVLQKKYRRIENAQTRCEMRCMEDAKSALVAYGSMARIAASALETLRRQGVRVGLVRPVTLWPFPKKEFFKVSQKVKNFLVIEMSYGQMVEDVRLAVGKKAEVYFYGRGGGGMPTEKQIVREVLKMMQKRKVKVKK